MDGEMEMRYGIMGRILTVGLILGLLCGCGGRTDGGTAPDPVGQDPVQAEDAAPADLTGALADIEVEGYGTITVALDPGTAPGTVANFVSLAESGFYDGLTFHRIMDGFMIQGGDPDGNGTGGSGTTIRGEFAANGIENDLSHVRGTVSMARSSLSYDSASSQFFIVQTDSTFLDGGYAAFGTVTEGMGIVDAICADAEPLDDNGTIAPEAQPVIASVTIRRDAAS